MILRAILLLALLFFAGMNKFKEEKLEEILKYYLLKELRNCFNFRGGEFSHLGSRTGIIC
jgi:hypothetical protein